VERYAWLLVVWKLFERVFFYTGATEGVTIMMLIVFDTYHRTAEILFVGEYDDCLVVAKDWWMDMMGVETDWEKLEWRKDKKGNMVQSDYEPMMVIKSESIMPCESFHESGIYLGILYNA
jgi:hypothetical protein